MTLEFIVHNLAKNAVIYLKYIKSLNLNNLSNIQFCITFLCQNDQRSIQKKILPDIEDCGVDFNKTIIYKNEYK